jgi:hypothetical protein
VLEFVRVTGVKDACRILMRAWEMDEGFGESGLGVLAFAGEGGLGFRSAKNDRASTSLEP